MISDDELERCLDVLAGSNQSRRRMGRRIVAEQRAAVERDRAVQRAAQERERQEFAFMHLPLYMRRTAYAVMEAERLERRGVSPERIERQLFGAPPDASASGTFRYASALLRAEDKCPLGLMAAVSAQVEGWRRAEEAAMRTHQQTRAEAYAFGSNMARMYLNAAGWPQEEL